jgi:adenosylcobinamide-GDP ribazoletransferase
MIFFLRSFQAALVAFTRLPLSSPRLQTAHFHYAHYFLPVIGLVIGGGMGISYSVCATLLPHESAVIIGLITGVLLTGALHEDGFADCCDGFGGTHSQEKILAIMKDSRLGSYGVIGLIALFSLKFSLLIKLPAQQLTAAWLCASILGRTSPLFVMHMIARTPSQEAKMSAQMATHPFFLILALGFAGLGLSFFYSLFTLLGLFIAVFITSALAARYFKKRIHGYNGDCLGAIEQLCEVLVLLFLCANTKLMFSL